MKLKRPPNQKEALTYLDSLLAWYKNKKNPYPKGIRVTSTFAGHFKGVSMKDLVRYEESAKQRLIRDGFIEEGQVADVYEITFEGLCFEGYVERDYRKKKIDRRWTLITRWIAITALAISIANISLALLKQMQGR